MKSKINYNSRQKEMILSLHAFDNIDRYHFLEKFPNEPFLNLPTILDICAQAWGIDPLEFKGKINHNNQVDKIRKTSFWFACYIYSNCYTNEIQEFLSNKCHGMFYRSVRTVYYQINSCSKFAEALLKLAFMLKKACPNRIKNAIKVDFSLVQNVQDWNGLCGLTAYQIEKIPPRDSNWFYNSNKRFSILAFHPARERECKYVISADAKEDCVLLLLQLQGYKFLKVGEEKNFKSLHPLCDKCINKNSCKNVGDPFYANKLFSIAITEKNACFTPLPDDKFRVDINLLLPLADYQLQ